MQRHCKNKDFRSSKWHSHYSKFNGVEVLHHRSGVTAFIFHFLTTHRGDISIQEIVNKYVKRPNGLPESSDISNIIITKVIRPSLKIQQCSSCITSTFCSQLSSVFFLNTFIKNVFLNPKLYQSDEDK